MLVKYLDNIFKKYPFGLEKSRYLFEIALRDYLDGNLSSEDLSYLANLVYYEWNDTFEITANWPRDFEKVLFETTELDWYEEQAKSKNDPKARKKCIEIRKLLKEYASKM